ncbi:MAG TPA: hypothetical protein VEO01_12445 [Pseudonocardiaceae bacterium]|nr:hypothetical protein [Pseudonocardiaceae bacterium]
MSPLSSRERLPKRRSGLTHSVEVNGAAMFATLNTYPDGRPGEVFAKWGKEGSTSGGLMDAFSIMLSIALQHGAPARTIVEKLLNMRFEPWGMTDDADIAEVSSVMDWLARRIALDFLSPEERADLKIFSIDEQARQLTTEAQPQLQAQKA